MTGKLGKVFVKVMLDSGSSMSLLRQEVIKDMKMVAGASGKVGW